MYAASRAITNRYAIKRRTTETIVEMDADNFLLNTGTRIKQTPIVEINKEIIRPSAAYCYLFCIIRHLLLWKRPAHYLFHHFRQKVRRVEHHKLLQKHK